MFTSIFLLFGAFIVLCGIHHLLHTISFWYPIYGIEAMNDVVMAVVSIGTFFALLPIIPQALKLQSPKELTIINKQLSQEAQNRKQAEDNLRKNQEILKRNQDALTVKNAELEKLNTMMIGRELKMTELKEKIDRKSVV